MFISPVGFRDNRHKKSDLAVKQAFRPNFLNQSSDSVEFKGLMPNKAKNALKMCVYDLDETLLEGAQAVRNKVLKFSKESNKVLVYSSARPLRKVQPLIDDKTLIMPDWCVCNNGVNVYKNNNGKFEEIKPWFDGLMKNFDKVKIRESMVEISKKHMFTDDQWAKVPKEIIPEGQKEFRGSRITEYESFGEDSNIRFMMTPGIFKKINKEFEQKIAAKGIEASVSVQVYDKNELVVGFLEKYFHPDIARDIRNHKIPRADKFGNNEVAIVSVKTDKGAATEYIRKMLKIKPDEVLASGDAENDFTHTNKGYFFAMLSNATNGLKKMMSKSPNVNIIEAQKPGVDGIYEVIKA